MKVICLNKKGNLVFIMQVKIVYFKVEKYPTNQQVLNVMKHESKHEQRISNNLIIDAEASKTFCDKICLQIKHILSGYIQEVNLNPFGFLFVTGIQANTN